jgi:hypothetical protein
MAIAPSSTPPDVIPTPGAPGPEMPPTTPTEPDIYPGQGTPEEVPQVPDPDVGTPPEQVPTLPGPDLVPPPAPSPGGPPVMAAAKLVLLAGLIAAGLAPRAAWAQAAR